MTFFGRRSPKPDFLSRCRDALEEAQSLKREALAEPGGSLDAAKHVLQVAVKSFAHVTRQIGPLFRSLQRKRITETEKYRAYQVDHGQTHDAQAPNLFSTVMVVLWAWLLETITTTGVMVGDGTMDIATGAIYGATFSGVTVAIGLCTGYFAFRYVCFRLHSPYPISRDRAIRFFAWCGAFLGVGSGTGLAFAAMRVRAGGGEHSDIWNYDAVPLSQTFSGYFELVLPVIAMLSMTLAIYKGIVGIKDRYPGHLEARQAAETEIINAADDLRDLLQDNVDSAYETALDALEPIIEAHEDAQETRRTGRLEYAKLIAAHNNAVETAREQAHHWTGDENTRAAYIAQRTNASSPPAFDDGTFDALLIPESELVDFDEPDEIEGAVLLAELESAYSEAQAAILEGYTTFLTNSASLFPDDAPRQIPMMQKETML